MTAPLSVRARPGASTLRRPVATRAARLAVAAVTTALAAWSAAAPAAAWEVRSDAPAADFTAFHRRFSFVAYGFPRHAARPLGTIGFEIFVDAGADSGLDDEEFWGRTVTGEVTGGWVAVGRVGARKGLPGGFDLGASYGRSLGGDVGVVTVDLQKALLHGGPLSPAFAVRLTAGRSVGGGPYSFDQFGAEVLLSKGFTVLTPYVGAGVLYSDGNLERAGGGELTTDFTQGFVYAGLTLNLLVPKITLEVEDGEVRQGALRVAFGF